MTQIQRVLTAWSRRTEGRPRRRSLSLVLLSRDRRPQEMRVDSATVQEIL